MSDQKVPPIRIQGIDEKNKDTIFEGGILLSHPHTGTMRIADGIHPFEECELIAPTPKTVSDIAIDLVIRNIEIIIKSRKTSYYNSYIQLVVADDPIFENEIKFKTNEYENNGNKFEEISEDIIATIRSRIHTAIVDTFGYDLRSKYGKYERCLLQRYFFAYEYAIRKIQNNGKD